MLLDFGRMDERIFEGMNGGRGAVAAKMFMDKSGKLIVSRILPNASIGTHLHATSNDINFVVSGMGIATCDGVEEELRPGVCHYCAKGSSHSIRNTGNTDLVLYTVVEETGGSLYK